MTISLLDKITKYNPYTNLYGLNKTLSTENFEQVPLVPTPLVWKASILRLIHIKTFHDVKLSRYQTIGEFLETFDRIDVDLSGRWRIRRITLRCLRDVFGLVDYSFSAILVPFAESRDVFQLKQRLVVVKGASVFDFGRLDGKMVRQLFRYALKRGRGRFSGFFGVVGNGGGFFSLPEGAEKFNQDWLCWVSKTFLGIWENELKKNEFKKE